MIQQISELELIFSGKKANKAVFRFLHSKTSENDNEDNINVVPSDPDTHAPLLESQIPITDATTTATGEQENLSLLERKDNSQYVIKTQSEEYIDCKEGELVFNSDVALIGDKKENDIMVILDSNIDLKMIDTHKKQDFVVNKENMVQVITNMQDTLENVEVLYEVKAKGDEKITLSMNATNTIPSIVKCNKKSESGNKPSGLTTMNVVSSVPMLVECDNRTPLFDSKESNFVAVEKYKKDIVSSIGMKSFTYNKETKRTIMEGEGNKKNISLNKTTEVPSIDECSKDIISDIVGTGPINGTTNTQPNKICPNKDIISDIVGTGPINGTTNTQPDNIRPNIDIQMAEEIVSEPVVTRESSFRKHLSFFEEKIQKSKKESFLNNNLKANSLYVSFSDSKISLNNNPNKGCLFKNSSWPSFAYQNNNHMDENNTLEEVIDDITSSNKSEQFIPFNNSEELNLSVELDDYCVTKVVNVEEVNNEVEEYISVKDYIGAKDEDIKKSCLDLCRNKIYYVDNGEEYQKMDWSEASSIARAKILGLKYPKPIVQTGKEIDGKSDVENISEMKVENKARVYITRMNLLKYESNDNEAVCSKTYKSNFGKFQIDSSLLIFDSEKETDSFCNSSNSNESNDYVVKEGFIYNILTREEASEYFKRSKDALKKIFYIVYTMKEFFSFSKLENINMDCNRLNGMFVFIIPIGKDSTYENYKSSLLTFSKNIVNIEKNLNKSDLIVNVGEGLGGLSNIEEDSNDKWFFAGKTHSETQESESNLNSLKSNDLKEECGEMKKQNQEKEFEPTSSRYADIIKTHSYQPKYIFVRKEFSNLPKEEKIIDKRYQIDYRDAKEFKTLNERERKEFSIFCSKRLRKHDGSSKITQVWRSIKDMFTNNIHDEEKYYKPHLIDENIYKIGEAIIENCTTTPCTFRLAGNRGFFYFAPIFLHEFTFGYDKKYKEYKANKTYDWIYADQKKSILDDWCDFKKWLKKELYSYFYKHDYDFLIYLNDYDRILKDHEKKAINTPILYAFINNLSALRPEDAVNETEDQEALTDLEFEGLLMIGMDSKKFVECILQSSISVVDLGNIYIGYHENVLRTIFPHYAIRAASALGTNRDNLESNQMNCVFNRFLLFSLTENERRLFMFTLAIWERLESNLEHTKMTVAGCIVCLCPSLIEVDRGSDIKNALLGSVQMLQRLVAYLNLELIDVKTYKEFKKYLKSKDEYEDYI